MFPIITIKHTLYHLSVILVGDKAAKVSTI